MKKNVYIIFLLILFAFLDCKRHNSEENLQIIQQNNDSFIKGVDISYLPEIETYPITFYNLQNQPEDMLTTLKNAGVNTIRVRLWKNPSNAHSGFEEVKAFAQRIKAKNMKVWLTVHYSDTWADPAHQIIPQIWQNTPLNALKDSIYAYTRKIMTEIKPEIIQIGNEINSGFVHPLGSISNLNNFKSLLLSGIQAVRNTEPSTKIMLHFAGLGNDADWFFEQIATLDYDYIGLSYYPLWHGKDLMALSNTLVMLKNKYQKEVLIAETSYPFTFLWNDWTNNVIGLDNQIIDTYSATPTGQKSYLLRIKEICKTGQASGFCYWGGEWVAFKGNQSQVGSSWENQALYNFENKALPVLEVFKN